jgi:hypothetical protein
LQHYLHQEFFFCFLKNLYKFPFIYATMEIGSICCFRKRACILFRQRAYAFYLQMSMWLFWIAKENKEIRNQNVPKARRERRPSKNQSRVLSLSPTTPHVRLALDGLQALEVWHTMTSHHQEGSHLKGVDVV